MQDAVARPCRTRRRSGREERLLEAVGQAFVKAREQVPVRPERCADRPMPTKLLDLRGVRAGGDGEGDSGVPEVMRPQRCETSPLDGRRPVAAIDFSRLFCPMFWLYRYGSVTSHGDVHATPA